MIAYEQQRFWRVTSFKAKPTAVQMREPTPLRVERIKDGFPSRRVAAYGDKPHWWHRAQTFLTQ